MQTKKESLTEALANVLIGYLLAVFSQLIVFPLCDIHTTFKNNLKIGLYFTIISLIRNYIIRRFFNKKENK